MLLILSALFPLIILIGLGYFLKQKQIIHHQFWEESEKFNYYFLFPALFIYTLSHAQIDILHLWQIIVIMVFVILMVTIFLYIWKTRHQIITAQFGVHVQGIIRYNSYISLALVSSLFGAQGMGILAILLAISIPLINIIAIVALTEQHRFSLKYALISLIKNPLILSCTCGILFNVIFNVLHIQFWQGIDELLKLLAAMSLPMGLLCVGAALQFKQIKRQKKSILINSLLRLLMMPILTGFICIIIGIDSLERQILILFFAIPTGTATYILTKLLKGDHQLMAAIISVQTVASAITLPLLFLLNSKL